MTILLLVTQHHFFTNGDRYINIIHTRLKHNCALKYNLYTCRCNIINSKCSFGKPEDTYHFFQMC